MSRTADGKRYFTWRQRRRTRLDLAVLAALIQGDTYLEDVQRRIGGTRRQMMSAAERLIRAGLINPVLTATGDQVSDFKYTVTEWWLTHPCSYDSDRWR